jgi:hypothetical protein
VIGRTDRQTRLKMTQQEERAIGLPKARCWSTRKPLKTIAETYFTLKCGNLLDGCEVDLHPCARCGETKVSLG